MENTVLFKNAAVFQNGRFSAADLFVKEGVFAPAASAPGDAPTVDCSGLAFLPGFADVHVHLREPGFSYKETIATGTGAAARGGYTAVCPMPNLSPSPDDLESLQAELSLIRSGAAVRVYPYGTLTRGEKGETISALEETAPFVIGFSDDGRGVQNAEIMRAAMLRAKSLGKIVAAHCEDNALLRGGYIHDGAYARAHGHRGICSESEWGPIRRDLELVRETGCAYHVCHVSTKESVALIRQAKREGLDVTCETAPHYLLLDETCLEEDGRFKMNPPLRSPQDREALLEGVSDGTVDMIATDHAPHSAEEKSRGLEGSAMGVVGLETAFPVLYTGLVKTGVLTFARLMELLNGAPRRRFGVGGEISDGKPADFTVFDLDRRYVIDPGEFLSKGRSTPFAGKTVYGRCLLTVCRGRAAWSDGTLLPPARPF